MTTVETEILSTRDLADRFAVSLHCVVAVVDRLGLASRIGRNRAVRAEDVPSVELGLIAAGYLRPARQGAARA